MEGEVETELQGQPQPQPQTILPQTLHEPFDDGHDSVGERGFEDLLDYGMWANHFFFLGSILFVASPLLELQEDSRGPIADILASLCFVIGAPFYFLDWVIYCDNSLLENGNGVGLYKSGVPPTDQSYNTIYHTLQPIDWYFYSNIFYAIASFADLCISLTDLVQGPTPRDLDMFFDFLSSHSWAISGVCAILGWFFQTVAREYHCSPVQYTLSPWVLWEERGGGRGGEEEEGGGEVEMVGFGEEGEGEVDGGVEGGVGGGFVVDGGGGEGVEGEFIIDFEGENCQQKDKEELEEEEEEEEEKEEKEEGKGKQKEEEDSKKDNKEKDQEKEEIVLEFDWTGLGDWFFLPAGVAYAVGSYVCFFTSYEKLCLWFQVVGAVGYLLDAIFYYPGLAKGQ